MIDHTLSATFQPRVLMIDQTGDHLCLKLVAVPKGRLRPMPTRHRRPLLATLAAVAIAAGCSSTPSRDWIRGYNDAADANASAIAGGSAPFTSDTLKHLCKLLAEKAHGVDVAQYMAGCTADHSHGPQQP
jgi:hypothetical protein